MPFNRPPLDLLIARSAASMQSRLPGTDAVLRRSLSGIVARMSAGTEHGLYGYLDWLARQLMPDTAEEEHLERWASIWGVSRKAAGHASGDVSITGTPGTVLPEGTICLRSDAVRYAVSPTPPSETTGREPLSFPQSTRERRATPRSEPFSPSLPPFPGSIRGFRLRTGLPAARTKRRTKA